MRKILSVLAVVLLAGCANGQLATPSSDTGAAKPCCQKSECKCCKSGHCKMKKQEGAMTEKCPMMQDKAH